MSDLSNIQIQDINPSDVDVVCTNPPINDIWIENPVSIIYNYYYNKNEIPIDVITYIYCN